MAILNVTKVVFAMGILALVFMVMPNVISKFTSQHVFISGADVDCTRCHPTENTEIHEGNVHLNVSCIDCHIPNNSTTSKPLYNPYGGGTASYHAAALVECLYCHGSQHYSRSGGLDCYLCHEPGTLKAVNVTAEFENSNIEAHRPLYFRAKNASGLDTSDLLVGANEACIACHTHAANVTVAHPTKYLNVTAYYTGTGPYSGWLINFSSNP